MSTIFVISMKIPFQRVVTLIGFEYFLGKFRENFGFFRVFAVFVKNKVFPTLGRQNFSFCPSFRRTSKENARNYHGHPTISRLVSKFALRHRINRIHLLCLNWIKSLWTGLELVFCSFSELVGWNYVMYHILKSYIFIFYPNIYIYISYIIIYIYINPNPIYD